MDDCAKKRFLIVALQILLVAVGGQCTLAQGPEFPYQAIIVTEGAKIHSGPGAMHYPTQELAQGDLVEVYRHDPGGWCAIRPTKNSFSLIPETAVINVQDNVGEIAEDGLQAWVGTSLGPVEKPLWQVKLRSGERIEILGEISWPDPQGHSTIWLQIAPPSGEFRWVHLDDIQVPVARNPEEFETAQIENATENKIANATAIDNQGWRPAKIPFQARESQIRQAFAEQAVNHSTNMIQQSSFQQEDEPRQTADQQPSFNRNQIDQDNQSAAKFEPFGQPQNHNPTINHKTVDLSPPERFASADAKFGAVPTSQQLREIQPLTSGNISARLRSIDMKLSAEIIKPTPQWRLQELAVETQSIINTTADLTERTTAHRLLDKIGNFAKIKDNTAAIKNSDPIFGNQNQAVGTGVVGNGASDELSSIYDATGWLNELVQRRGVLDSTFVLQDDAGNITHHIQPAPGLNLKRYLKSRVGVIGKRGFHQQFNLPHVIAERIVVLEPPINRK